MSNESTADESKNRKIGRIIAVIVAVVVVVALIIGGSSKKNKEAATDTTLPEGCKPGFLFSETSGKPCPQDKATTTDTTTPAPVATSAYEDAIRTYAGKVIVFDASCKPVATTALVTAGTRVLVANNSDKQLTLALGAKSEVLDGYHYFTTTLSAKGDAKVTCNSKDAVTITVK